MKNIHNADYILGVFSLFYKCTEEELYHPEIGYYVAYGIEAKASATGATVKKVSDLFLDKAKGMDFAKLLNECQPELVHFEEVCQSVIE